MDIWKQRPGLEATLMRTMNVRYWHDQRERKRISQLYKKQRYDLWIKTDEARDSAANAIQELFLNYKKRKINAYKRLIFIKVKLDYDVIQEILKYI